MTRPPFEWTLGAFLLCGVLGFASYSTADDAPATPAEPPAEPAPAERSEDVMRDLDKLVEPNPLIEPSTSKPPTPTAPPVAGTAYDPAVLGTAPGQPQPKLRREGEFIVNRKGRLIRSSDTGQSLFLFDADSENAAEAPMPLLPCQMLQNIEDLSRERGDSISFILSGQITTYRNTNFLMPTMMKLDVDRGNLQR